MEISKSFENIARKILGKGAYDTEKYYTLPKDDLGSIMRKHGHFLDKDSRREKQGFARHVEIISVALDAWEKRFDTEDPTYKWAKMIVETYQKGEIADVKKWPKIEANDFEVLSRIMINRRSIRKWTEEPVPQEMINKVIDAGRAAPTSCNRQTLKYVVITDKEDIEYIGKNSPGGRDFLNKAPVIVVVLANSGVYHTDEEPALDAGITVQNMLLAVHALGLGGFSIGAAFSEETAKWLTEKYKIDSKYKIGLTIAFGYPAEYPVPPARRTREDIVHSVQKDEKGL